MKKIGFVLLGGIAGCLSGVLFMRQKNEREVKEKNKKVDKFKKYYNTLNYWLEAKAKGQDIMGYFKENNIKNIVIYGMGEMGNRLYEQLKDENINVMYAIDKNPVSSYSELEVIGDAKGENSQVDLVIVTPIFDFDFIKEELESCFSCEIVSLEDIIFEM